MTVVTVKVLLGTTQKNILLRARVWASDQPIKSEDGQSPVGGALWLVGGAFWLVGGASWPVGGAFWQVGGASGHVGGVLWPVGGA